MKFRKFFAERIFDGKRFLGDDFVLITEPEGKIVDIINRKDAGDNIEEFDGTLTPGFINCHCHLELSHLKNIVPQKTGLVDFLITVVNKRGEVFENKNQQIKDAAIEMYNAGIVGVADICNTVDAIEIKRESKIRWYNLIEVINFYDATADEKLKQNIEILNEHKVLGDENALTPHAPYSVSAKTLDAINELTEGKIISIHNQETSEENELFKNGGGSFLKMYQTFFDGRSPFEISGKSSLQTYLPHFNKGQTIILVHNTYINEDDIVFAQECAEKNFINIVYCLCPNANLYIEDRLPAIQLLLKHECKIVLGTDSYSSNWQLSIANEIQTIKKVYPQIPLEELLQWATLDAAKIMRWDEFFGSFERGKKPGVVLLKHDLTAERIL